MDNVTIKFSGLDVCQPLTLMVGLFKLEPFSTLWGVYTQHASIAVVLGLTLVGEAIAREICTHDHMYESNNLGI